MGYTTHRRRRPADVANDDTVAAALAAATNARCQILDRQPLSWGSSHFIEILGCTVDGEPHRILCKYAHEYARGGSEHVDASFGHRKGVALEAQVYAELVSQSGLPAPYFHGSHSDGNGQAWLFIQHFDGALRVSKAEPYVEGLKAAATWIGRFHRAFEAAQPDFLDSFEEHYFTGWGHRTVALMEQVATVPGWLPGLAARATEWAAELAGGPRTAIHGEYYMHNILHHDGVVYPIDWETAAWGIGEIDLATLTEGVEPDIAAACIDSYLRARWPNADADGWERRLGLARIYLHLRWLGEDPRPTARQHEWRIPRLQAEAAGLGLI